MPDDTTVIYYTSNRERPKFEKKIQDGILESSGGLPIISVSQKPISFGHKNICVGDVGASGRNALRQMQIGVKEAKTKYIATAESDIIYPKEYFSFIPPRDDVPYLASPTWVCFCQKGWVKYYARKWRGDSNAMVVNREFILDRLNTVLSSGDGAEWGVVTEKICLLHGYPMEYFYLPTPILTFKTNNNMHLKTTNRAYTKTLNLSPFGEVHDLIRRYGP